MRRSWLDIYPEEADETRPTRTGQRWVSTGRGRLSRSPSYTGGRMEQYEDPIVTREEILDKLIKRFNQQQVAYKTDPATGQVVATKSMARPEMPSEVADSRYARYFGEGDPLKYSWRLPKGALSGPSMLQREAPASDIERQGAYRFGVSNVGQNVAIAHPQTHWPESAFKVPMGAGYGEAFGGVRGYPGGYTAKEPQFGGSMDYTTGTWRAPQGAATEGYGEFDKQFKTPPGYGRFPALPAGKLRRTQGIGFQGVGRGKRVEQEGQDPYWQWLRGSAYNPHRF